MKYNALVIGLVTGKVYEVKNACGGEVVCLEQGEDNGLLQIINIHESKEVANHA